MLAISPTFNVLDYRLSFRAESLAELFNTKAKR
jgi:hypothetical protein